MRLDYPYVFDTEDYGELLTGYNLTRGYVRFLIQLASQYHTFYQDGLRVDLSDTEKQLLESGAERLADVLINGWKMNTTKLIGSFSMLTPTQISGDNTVTATWSQDFADPEYLTFVQPNQFALSKPGNYQVIAKLFVNQDQPDAGGFALADLRYNKNGGPDNIIEHTVWSPGVGLHAHLNLLEVWPNAGWFYIRVRGASSGTVYFTAQYSWLRIVRVE